MLLRLTPPAPLSKKEGSHGNQHLPSRGRNKGQKSAKLKYSGHARLRAARGPRPERFYRASRRNTKTLVSRQKIAGKTTNICQARGSGLSASGGRKQVCLATDSITSTSSIKNLVVTISNLNIRVSMTDGCLSTTHITLFKELIPLFPHGKPK